MPNKPEKQKDSTPVKKTKPYKEARVKMKLHIAKYVDARLTSVSRTTAIPKKAIINKILWDWINKEKF